MCPMISTDGGNDHNQYNNNNNENQGREFNAFPCFYFATS